MQQFLVGFLLYRPFTIEAVQNLSRKRGMRVKKFKLFGLIHPADILWAVILVVLVFGAIQFTAPQEVSARPGDVQIRYTIELGDRRNDAGERRLSREGFHEKIQTGYTLLDAQRGLPIGTIVNVYALPFQVDSFDEEGGVIRRATVEGLEYVRIVVEARAQISDYETLIGQFPVAVGREAVIRSKHFAGEGFIIAIEEI